MQETERQYTERVLREMLDEAKAAEDALVEAKVAKKAKADKAAKEAEEHRRSAIDDLFRSAEWPQPPKAQFPKLGRKADRRSDFVIAALGVTLGLICALFPWYIFFNQEQFGVQAIKFGGTGTNTGRAGGGVVAQRSAPLTAQDVPSMDIDLLATATVPDKAEDPAQAPGLDQQPFPADAAKIRLVHVANGRAMIEDDTGLWIVQRGSKLPDASSVSSIEQRHGKWVMVTSTNNVIELSK